MTCIWATTGAGIGAMWASTKTASWKRRAAALTLGLIAAQLAAAPPAMAQFSQQGPKLVGTGNTGMSAQGWSVAVSADGKTAIVGGIADNGLIGGAWVFTSSGGTWTQQGSELVGTGYTGTPEQGYSVALSADGNTALVGGPSDNTASCSGLCMGVGAAWVFTRSNGVWSQQGSKLLGGGGTGDEEFGDSVALSADGNTAIVGGPGNISGVGGAWVFTRSGATWTQQGFVLIGNGANGNSAQGSSVALSADGNTAIVGGAFDNSGVGAAWVWTRSGGVWAQQGSKLTASDASGDAEFGSAAGLSADGNTAIVGGPDDNSDVGAAWIFTQSGGVWTQQGSKLVGTDSSGAPEQGTTVALSADGDTAMIGGPDDNGTYHDAVGAAWIFTRTGGVWTQQGAKVTANDETGNGDFGSSVALSGDGNIAIVGAFGDNAGIGAAWVFVTPASLQDHTNSHDFNDDGVSDILWSDSGGDLAMWLMSAGQFSSGATLGNVGTSWHVAGTRDFNGDGHADILWLDNAGDVAIWLMNGAAASSYANLGNVGTQWSVAGTGDFNGDGTGDILWRNTTTGDVAIWLMSNGALSSGVDLGTVPLTWQIAGTGDFNGDGTTDILWRNTANGELAIWFMSNGQVSSSLNVGRVSTDWTVVGTGDFNGDLVSDILWRDSEGDLAIWLMNSSGQMASGTTFTGIPTTWTVAETGDFNGDGTSDILWIDGSGDLGVWLMDGLTVSSALGLGNVGTTWTVQGVNAD